MLTMLIASSFGMNDFRHSPRPLFVPQIGQNFGAMNGFFNFRELKNFLKTMNVDCDRGNTLSCRFSFNDDVYTTTSRNIDDGYTSTSRNIDDVELISRNPTIDPRK